MSRSARLLASDVVTAQFPWQAAPPPSGGASFHPRAIVFAQSGRDPAATADSPQDVEARELHLPSPSAEHLQTIETRAFAEGHTRGLEAGEARANADLDALTQRFVSTIDDVAALRAGVMRRAERELVQLALVMAERIVRKQVDMDPDLLLVMARVAIDRLGEQATATVRLHPDDYEAVSRVKLDDIRSIELVADPGVVRGGCLIQSEFGVIDAGIESQIRELSRELLGEEADHGVGAGF